jgi:hypothetical protein
LVVAANAPGAGTVAQSGQSDVVGLVTKQVGRRQLKEAADLAQQLGTRLRDRVRVLFDAVEGEVGSAER